MTYEQCGAKQIWNAAQQHAQQPGEVLTRPTEPGLYWCRNVEGLSENIAIVGPIKMHNLGPVVIDGNMMAISEGAPPPGEYMRIPEPVWPEPAKLPPLVLIKASYSGNEFWCVKVCRDTFSCIGDSVDGWCLVPFHNARIIPHPANDPELEQKIREAQR